MEPTNTCEKCGVTGLFDNELHPHSVESALPMCFDCWHGLVDHEMNTLAMTREYLRTLRVERGRI